MYVAKVVAHGTKIGTLDLLCPALFGGHTLRGLLPLQSSESWGLPNPGDEVIVEHFGGGSYRWTPKTLNTPPAWARANRRGFSDPSNTMLVVADGDTGKVYLATIDADKKVVHEGAHAQVFGTLKAAVDALAALVVAIPVPGGTVGTEPTLAGLVASMQSAVTALAAVTVASYTASAVVVPPTTEE